MAAVGIVVDLAPLRDLLSRRIVRRGVVHTDVGDELLAGDQDQCLAHLGVAGEAGLDLAGFDAQTAQLDLVVAAADEIDAAVGEPAHQIARGVHARAVVVERAGQEAAGIELRPPAITGGDAGAGNVQLADDTGRHRLQRGRRGYTRSHCR